MDARIRKNILLRLRLRGHNQNSITNRELPIMTAGFQETTHKKVSAHTPLLLQFPPHLPSAVDFIGRDPAGTPPIRVVPSDVTARRSTLRKLGVGVAAVGAVTVTGALAIPLAGFGVGGVAAGSLAATAQSALFGGAACGGFSALQSAGATLLWAPFAAGGATAVVAGGTAVSLSSS